MTLDLDQALEGILEWDFPIKANGQTFPTRPLLLADFARFVHLKDDTILDATCSLFAGDAAEILAWVNTMRSEQMSAAINGTMLYAKQVMSKNSPAIASAVSKAMARTEQVSEKSSGSSTPS